MARRVRCGPLKSKRAVVVGERRRRRLGQAATLIGKGRLIEAEALCREVLGGRGGARALMAAAHHDLSVIATRRGDQEEALLHLRAAIRLAHSAWRRSVQVEVLAYQEIRLLVALGRVGEARARMQARGDEPEGDYLRLLHATAELAVCFGENVPPRDEDVLWERSRAALRISQGAVELLGLCAWAFDRRGDGDMADHLAGEARERAEAEDRAALPALWAWIDQRGGA